jgi:hypothetical protein
MTRDILDYLGNKLGEISEPEGISWTEEEWEGKLSPYAAAPPTVEEQTYVALERTVLQSRAWADEIIEEFKKENLAYFLENSVPNDLAIMVSLHVHHRLRAIDITVGGLPLTIDLMNLVISGDLETAFVVLSYMEPDDMTMPYHWFSQERINSLKAKIATRVGL